MNTKIIYTHPFPACTVLINEATGQKLYKIESSRRFVGSVTKVFRYDTATPVSNLISPSHLDANEPGSEEGTYQIRGEPVRHENEDEGGNTVVAAGEGASEADNLPLAENEIARLYWKWFASTRMVWEGKIQRRAKYMPFGDGLRLSFVFSHKGISYRWSLGTTKLRPKLLVNDSSKTLIAQFYPTNLFKKRYSYMEVTPAGMGMLDHVIVTYIPVEVRRREL